MLAETLRPVFADHLALGATLLYWISVPIVGLVEHDAYILTFLYTIRDLGADGVPTWPLWWMLLWSGTLGSNLTVAGAPALYVALTIGEKEEGRKVSLREFLSWSVPFHPRRGLRLLRPWNDHLGSPLCGLRKSAPPRRPDEQHNK